MRTMLYTVLVAFMMSFMIAPAQLASADDDEAEPLLCTFELSIDLSLPDAHWQGSMDGDVVGTIELWERADNFVVGGSEHFFEDITITTDAGKIIGWDKGIWTFSTYKFRSHGLVTDVTADDLSYLVGCKLLFMGFTSEFPPSEGTIVTAEGTLMMMPA